MRLKKLHVRDRGVLQRLDLDLSQQFLDRPYGLDFIVGVNGTGKSTVLRTIAHLIDALGRGAELNYPFKLVLSRDAGDGDDVTLTNMDENGNWRKLAPGAPDRRTSALPMVILFAAGNSPAERYERSDIILDEALRMSSVERLEAESPGHVPLEGEEEPDPDAESQVGLGQVLTITSEHLPLVMLCGWLTDRRLNKGALKAAFEGANVHRICGFSLRVLLGAGFDEQDPTLLKLASACSRQVRSGSDYLLVFDERHNPQMFGRLVPQVDDGLVLYRELLALFEQRVGDERRLRIDLIVERTAPSKRAVPPLHLFDWLSDGEQAFLGRMALFPLLGETEAIVMLDEPENHFNDIWKREIIRFLDQSLKENKSHILISTHASITLTDVPLEHIHILQHDGCYTVDVEKPSVQTFGVDASDIMSEVFGTPQSTGRFSAEHIRGALQDIARKRLNRAGRTAALTALLAQVGPGYWSYVVREQLRRVAGAT